MVLATRAPIPRTLGSVGNRWRYFARNFPARDGEYIESQGAEIQKIIDQRERINLPQFVEGNGLAVPQHQESRTTPNMEPETQLLYHHFVESLKRYPTFKLTL